jgi:hypothetical protein
VRGKKGFAAAIITVQEGNASEQETLLPEPADRLGFDVGKIFLVDGKG